MSNNYTIQLTKTMDGLQEYVQIMSEDLLSVNIVLIGKFALQDQRQKQSDETKRKPK